MEKKAQITKLLSLGLDLEIFYSIRIYRSTIHLQGELNILNKTHCESLGFEFSFEDNWLVAKKDNVEITLMIA